MHFFNACSNQKATILAKRAKKSAAKPSDLVIPLYPAIPAYPFLKRPFVLNNEECPVKLEHNVFDNIDVKSVIRNPVKTLNFILFPISVILVMLTC